MYKMANFMQKIQDLIFFKLQKKKKSQQNNSKTYRYNTVLNQALMHA